MEPAVSARWPLHTPVLVDEPGVGALVPLGPAASGGGSVPTLATAQGHRVFVAELGPGPLLSYRARVAFAGTFGWPGARAWVNQDARAQLEGAGMALSTDPAR